MAQETSIPTALPADDDRLLHRLALVTAVATFPLIFMGGLVTSRHAGMSVPDWPNSYGYNMFRFPPRLWVGGIFYEHTHRLMATVVGFLSVLLCARAWLSGGLTSPRNSRRVRYLCLAVLLGVIAQGVVGGLRVVFAKLDLAIVHACLGQAVFCLAGLTALLTSREWHSTPDLSGRPSAAAGRGLIGLTGVLVFTIFAQLIVGAFMRHYGAGLAIPDFPTAYGRFLPPLNAAELDRANHLRAWELNLDPVTMGQVWLHFGHRIGAVAVTLLVMATAVRVFRRFSIRTLLLPSFFLVALLLTQLLLGIVTVWLRKPADVASAHVAVGALTLVCSVVLLARAVRLYGGRREAATAYLQPNERPTMSARPSRFVPAGGTI